MKKNFLTWLFLLATAVGLAFSVQHYFFSERSLSSCTAHRGKAVQSVYATGSVEARKMIPLAARSSARIVSINVAEGQKVDKNTILVQLENEEPLAAIEELQAKKSFLEKEFERQKKLLARNATAQESFDRAASELASLRATIKAAEIREQYLQITAPVDGTVIRRDGEPGELISANTPILWLASEEPLRITAEVDEEDIALVSVGQEVLIRADAFPGEIFAGRVAELTPKGDVIARSYRVRIDFIGETPLLIGMTVENNIIVRREENALLIPTSALLQNQIWSLQAGKAKSLQVRIGARGTEFTEVTQGLSETDEFLCNPPTDISEGDTIRTKLKSQSTK